MRVLSSVIGTTFFASVLGACNQCPLPPLNASAFAPCLQQVVGQGCCAVGRPMVNNPCVKVWLANPLLAPFAGVIEKARVACNVNQMAACTPAVAQACPTECSVPSTASTQAAGNPSVGAAQMNPMMMNQNSSMMMQNSSMMMQNSSMRMQNSSMMMQNSSMMQNTMMMNPNMMQNNMMQNSSMMMMNSTMMNNATYLVQNTTCPANETYTSCASSSCWEHNCTNGAIVTPGPFCTLICRQGCKCLKGFARNTQTGRCVAESQCSTNRVAAQNLPTMAPTPVCPQNETYTTCSSTSCFEHTCMNNTLMIPGPICTLACRQGCQCQTGFARNATGGCIPESQCTMMGMMMMMNNVTCAVRAAADRNACGRRIGCAITTCNADGSYASKQCSGSTGYCWCVDTNGNEIANTRLGPGQGQVNCAATGKAAGKAKAGKAKNAKKAKAPTRS